VNSALLLRSQAVGTMARELAPKVVSRGEGEVYDRVLSLAISLSLNALLLIQP
jgi:type III secretion system FlhB-like substrate exporter